MGKRNYGFTGRMFFIVACIVFILCVLAAVLWSYMQTVDFVAPILPYTLAGVSLKYWTGGAIQLGQTVFYVLGGMAGGINRKNIMKTPGLVWYVVGTFIGLLDTYTNIGEVGSLGLVRMDQTVFAYVMAVAVTWAEEVIAAVIAVIVHLAAEAWELKTGRHAPHWLKAFDESADKTFGRGAFRAGEEGRQDRPRGDGGQRPERQERREEVDNSAEAIARELFRVGGARPTERSQGGAPGREQRQPVRDQNAGQRQRRQ